MTVSRREFLNRVGRAGGYSAAFLMMQGMGLMPATAERAEPAAPGSGKGVKAVILGGGIAGWWRPTSSAPWDMNAPFSKAGRDQADETGRFAVETK
jgi:hypothetical protein